MQQPAAVPPGVAKYEVCPLCEPSGADIGGNGDHDVRSAPCRLCHCWPCSRAAMLSGALTLGLQGALVTSSAHCVGGHRRSATAKGFDHLV